MSEFDYDSDRKSADAPGGEFGFDYDSNDVLYHYGDGFATGSDGKQYMEAGGGKTKSYKNTYRLLRVSGTDRGDI